MKKFLTLRNILICSAALFALLVFIFSFVAQVRMTIGSSSDQSYLNVIWGSNAIKNNVSGEINYADAGEEMDACVLPLIGALLTLIGGLCAVVIAIFGEKMFKDAKVAKIVLFVAGGLVVLGGIFSFFTVEAFYGVLAKFMGITTAELKGTISQSGAKVSCGLAIVSGILGVLGGGAIIASQFVPEKSLVK